MTNNNNKLSIEKIDALEYFQRFAPRCQMREEEYYDEDHKWAGMSTTCKRPGTYEVSVYPVGWPDGKNKKYAHGLSCDEHLEETKKQMMMMMEKIELFD